MSPPDILSVIAVAVACAAAALQVIDKQSWVQKNKVLKTWIDDANDIAGELKLIIPMGANLADVEVAVEAKAAALVQKYAGSVTQAEVVTQIIGELARIVQSGHILPPSVQPEADKVDKLIEAVEALLAKQEPHPTTLPPAVSVGAGGGAGGTSIGSVSPRAILSNTPADASHVPLAPA